MSFVIKSSTITPVYEEDLDKTRGSMFCIADTAFIPQRSPWAAASSYPDVPFICPAKKRPEMFFDSREAFSCEGGK